MASKEDEFLAAYHEHNKILRTWLVAYGVGGPILIFSNEVIGEKFRRVPPESVRCIVCLFLAGVVFQVLLAFANKVLNWLAYDIASRHPTVKTWDSMVHRLVNCFAIDMALDLMTIVAFAGATSRAMLALLASG